MATSKPRDRSKNDRNLPVPVDRFQYHLLYVTRAAWLLKSIVICGTLAYIAYLLADATKALAGKATFAQVAVQWLASASLNVTVAWTATAVSATGWFLTARSKRMLQRKNLPRLEQLEKLIDSGRTSSGLTPEGESPSGDLL